MRADRIQRLLLEDLNARSVVVHLDGVVSEVLNRSHYPDAVARQLSKALVVAALCSSGIKFTGRISLQLRSTGPLKLLMADCTAEGGLRGIARFDDEAASGQRTFRELTEGGVLTLTLEPADQARVWQGVVPVDGNSLAASVTGYFHQSEQLPSRLRLAVSGDRAAGILIQQLPGRSGDADGWNRLEHLLATVTDSELLATDSETLFQRLFHAERRRLFPARPLHFHCPCNRERVSNVLRGLGAEELGALMQEQSVVEVSCEFCGEKYRFDRLDISGLLRSGISAGQDGGTTIH